MKKIVILLLAVTLATTPWLAACGGGGGSSSVHSQDSITIKLNDSSVTTTVNLPPELAGVLKTTLKDNSQGPFIGTLLTVENVSPTTIKFSYQWLCDGILCRSCPWGVLAPTESLVDGISTTTIPVEVHETCVINFRLR